MRFVAFLLGAASLAVLPSVANGATLFDQTNLSTQSSTSITRTFTAGGATTDLSFAGYNVPSWTYARDILLTLTGGSSNLLGQTWAFTPAAFGSDASQGGPGAYGTNNLTFGGVDAGYYDTFSQTVNTIAGDSYTLSFLLSSSGSPNALRVTATNTAAVPEPATWAMMLFGFAAAGISLRRRNRTNRALVPA